MADPDFWRKLGEEFRALVSQPSPYRTLLTAYWRQAPSGGNPNEYWSIAGADDSVQLQFQSLARRGALQLPRRPDCSLLTAWLELIRDTYPTFTGSSVQELGSSTHDPNGNIPDVAKLSADVCCMLESEELDNLSVVSPSNVAPTVSGPTDSTETLGAQISRLREECRWTLEELAEAVGLDPTNVSRHLSDKAIPQIRNLAAYERVFSKRLQKQVVIDKKPLKRR